MKRRTKFGLLGLALAGAGFAGDTNAVTIFSRTDAREVPLRGKREVAEAILDCVSELF